MRCNREEGRGSKNLKNDGRLGQGVGDLKKGGGGWNPLTSYDYIFYKVLQQQTLVDVKCN